VYISIICVLVALICLYEYICFNHTASLSSSEAKIVAPGLTNPQDEVFSVWFNNTLVLVFSVIFVGLQIYSLLEYDPRWREGDRLIGKPGRGKWLVPLIITVPLSAVLVWRVPDFFDSPFSQGFVFKSMEILCMLLIFSTILISAALDSDVKDGEEF